MRSILALLTCSLLCGCTTLLPSDDEMARIRSVRVSNVSEDFVSYSGSLPSEYEIEQGNGLMMIPLLAPIGVVVELFRYPESQKRKTRRLKQIFSQADIDMVRSVRKRFEQLAPGLVPVSSPSEAGTPIDAEIELRVSYGLTNAMGLGSDWTPWLEVEASMVDQAGEALWNSTVEVSVGDGRIHPLPFPDPFLDSGRFKAQYEEAAKVACHRLIAEVLDRD